MSDRPVRDRRPSTRLANYVVPVGGVRHTPPKNQAQRQSRQQSPVVDGAADMVGEQDDQYVPVNQVHPVAVVPVVRQEDIQQLDNLDVQDPEPVDLPEVDIGEGEDAGQEWFELEGRSQPMIPQPMMM